MTTETKSTTTVSGVPSWTPEEAQLIDIYQQKQGMSRSEAIRKLVNAKKKGRTAAELLCAFQKPQATVSTSELAEQQKALDFGINKKLTGKPQPTSKPVVDRAATRRAHAGKAPKAKKVKVAKDAEPLTPQKQAVLDRIIREAAGRDAIDRLLKSSLSPKYTRYQFWGTAKGNVVNCNIDAGTAKLMDDKSTTVKKWRRLQARELKREEAKLAKAAAKKAEAK